MMGVMERVIGVMGVMGGVCFEVCNGRWCDGRCEV